MQYIRELDAYLCLSFIKFHDFDIKLTHRLIFTYLGQFPASVLSSYSVAPAGVEFLRQ